MQARAKEVKRFIGYYDVIRSDKKAPVSRRDLDISFLAAQFDKFFFLGREGEMLTLYFASPKLIEAYGLKQASGSLRDIFPTAVVADLTLLFEEMFQCPDRGVLARFGNEGGDLSEDHELVMLPVVAPGEVSAIGVVARIDPPDAILAEGKNGARVSSPKDHLPLMRKSCFDLRMPLPPVGEGFLVQCMTALGKTLRSWGRT